MAHDDETENDVNGGQPKSRTSLFAVITGIIMVTIYLGMAFLLLFTNMFVGKVAEWVRYLMGVVFFLYGIFRGYRVYASNRKVL